MAKLQLSLVSLSLVALLGACAPRTTLTPVVAENDPVTLRLTQAAEKASNALNDIAAVEKGQHAPIPAEDFSSAPETLQQLTTITWNGPIEQVLKTFASRIGYRFNTVGKAPPVPLVVAVDVYEKPLIKVLHDIGMQLGPRADLAVDAQRGLIEVHYAAADKKG